MKEKETTAHLKARLYIGGLKSLFGDMHDIIADVEKTGQMPKDMLQSLEDVKEAIDLTVFYLKRATVKCCDHDTTEPHDCEEYENEEKVVEKLESKVKKTKVTKTK